MFSFRSLFIFIVCILDIHSKDISPVFSLHVSGLVSNFVVNEDRLYAATDMGSVDIFDLNTQKMVNRIVFEPLKTVMGDTIAAKVHSVDYLNGKLLILSSGSNRYRNVWIYENHILKKVIDQERKLFIKEARFVNDERIILGTFGSEMILYDTVEGYQVYNNQITQSTLGDIALGAYKKIIMSDESGEIRVLDVDSSKVEQVYDSQNVDNVYKVAYANGVIVTAGQDRRVGVYQKNAKPYYIKSDFLVYCVGITPSGKTGIYSSGVDSDLQLFDIKTKVKKDRLVGHKALVNTIIFINEKELFSSGDEKEIFFWSLD